MTLGLILIEGLVVCFIVLLCCVIGIANGPEGMAFFYEKKVQEKVVISGLITKEALDRNLKRFKFIGMVIMFAFILLAVRGYVPFPEIAVLRDCSMVRKDLPCNFNEFFHGFGRCCDAAVSQEAVTTGRRIIDLVINQFILMGGKANQCICNKYDTNAVDGQVIGRHELVQV